MGDDASLFEIYLRELDSEPHTDVASTASSQGEPPPQDRDLRDDLRLVGALRNMQAPHDEMRDARARVLVRLRGEMASTSADGDADTLVKTALPVPVSRRRRPRTRRLARVALVAAAILLLACTAGWQISTAAASALPGSPLYGIKRGEETLVLDMAWSDQRRGEVLAVIADHRLSEMRAEAALQNDALVHSLAREFDSTMHQLISLTATMAARHEDTTVVAAVLGHELNAEYVALNTAMRNGDVILAQTLTATVQSERAAIQNSHITLPPSVVGTAVPGPGTPPTARPSPNPRPSHTPPAGSGNNNGNGNNSGHSTNSGNHNSGNVRGDDDQDESSSSEWVGCPRFWSCAPTHWESGITSCCNFVRHLPSWQMMWNRTHQPQRA